MSGTLPEEGVSAERAMLSTRDRDELHQIASAMGVKGATRLRKADLIEAILEKVSGGGENIPEPTGERKKRTTKKKAADNGEAPAAAGDAPAAEAAPVEAAAAEPEPAPPAATEEP